MKELTLNKIAEVCHGQLLGRNENPSLEVTSVVINSRQVEEGGLFVAIPGERVDGHSFVKAVLEKGALGALVEKVPEDLKKADGEVDDTLLKGGLILVESTTQALKDLAEFYRSVLDIKVVGITGSVGKTSTKETIAAVLSQKYNVLKTAGNFNNEIGLPLTVFRIRDEHQVAVLEMGISDFGEMDRLAKIAKPDIGVITNIGTCHLENLGDRDGVLKEKSCMLKFLQPGGVAVLNGDDDKLSTLQNRFKEVVGVEPVKLDFFGVREEGVTELLPTSDLKAYATDIENLGLDGVAMKLQVLKSEQTGENGQAAFDARISIPGRHNVYNALAATCVGLELGLSIEEIQKGLAEAKTIQGRTNLIHHKDMILIDDCYNANPMSMKEALHVLENATGRKIAVLGDMGELGEREAELHGEVGEAFAASTVDTAFLAGKLMKNFEEKAKVLAPQKEVYYFESREEMTKTLLSYVKPGDAVLVKASHFMEFPKVLEALQN